MANEPQVRQRIGKYRVVEGAVDPQALAVRCDSNAVTGRRLALHGQLSAERRSGNLIRSTSFRAAKSTIATP